MARTPAGQHEQAVITEAVTRARGGTMQNTTQRSRGGTRGASSTAPGGGSRGYSATNGARFFTIGVSVIGGSDVIRP